MRKVRHGITAGPWLWICLFLLVGWSDEARGDDTKQLIDALNNYLIDMKTAGKTVVLLVDEAQNLTRNVMEQLRLLSNLETNRSKMLQIILVGQPELRKSLEAERLRQLRQRITVRYHLGPISRPETEEYILRGRRF